MLNVYSSCQSALKLAVTPVCFAWHGWLLIKYEYLLKNLSENVANFFVCF